MFLPGLMSEATLWKHLLQNILGWEKMNATLPTFSVECLTKIVCGFFFSFLHKEKSFSTSKWSVWATGPKCNEPCGLTQGLWALPETAWHPDCCCCWFSDCRKKPSKWHWLSPGSLGNLRCVGQLSCRISSVRVNVCILPGSQSQLVASYSEMGL